MKKMSRRWLSLLAFLVIGLSFMGCVVEKGKIASVQEVTIQDDAMHTLVFAEILNADGYLVELENQDKEIVFEKTISKSGDSLGYLIDQENILIGLYDVYMTTIPNPLKGYQNSDRVKVGKLEISGTTLAPAHHLALDENLVLSFESKQVEELKEVAAYRVIITSVSTGEQMTLIENSQTISIASAFGGDNGWHDQGAYKVCVQVISRLDNDCIKDSVLSESVSFDYYDHQSLPMCEMMTLTTDNRVTWSYDEMLAEKVKFLVKMISPTSIVTFETTDRYVDLSTYVTENGCYQVEVVADFKDHVYHYLTSNPSTLDFIYYQGEMPTPSNVSVIDQIVTWSYDEAFSDMIYAVELLMPSGRVVELTTADLKLDLSSYIDEYGLHTVSVSAKYMPNLPSYGHMPSSKAKATFEVVDPVEELKAVLPQFKGYQAVTDFKKGAYYAFGLTIESDGTNILVTHNYTNDYDREVTEKYYIFEKDGKYHLAKGTSSNYGETYKYVYLQALEQALVTSIQPFGTEFEWDKQNEYFVSAESIILQVIGAHILGEGRLTQATLQMQSNGTLQVTTQFTGNASATQSTTTFTALGNDYVLPIESEIYDLVPVQLSVPTDVVVTFTNASTQSISFTTVLGGYSYQLEVVNGASKYTYTVQNYSSDVRNLTQALYMSSTINKWTAGTYPVYMRVEASSSNQSKYLSSERVQVAELVIPEIQLKAPSQCIVDDAYVLTLADTNTIYTGMYRYEVVLTFPNQSTQSMYYTAYDQALDLSQYLTVEGKYRVDIQAVSTSSQAYIETSDVVSLTFVYTQTATPEELLIETIAKYAQYQINLTIKNGAYYAYDTTLQSDGQNMSMRIYDSNTDKENTYYFIPDENGTYHQFLQEPYGSGYRYSYVATLDQAPHLSLSAFTTLFTYDTNDLTYVSMDAMVLQIVGYGLYETTGITLTQASFTIDASGIRNFKAEYTGSQKGTKITSATFKILSNNINVPEEVLSLIPSQLAVPENWDFQFTNMSSLAYSFTKIENVYSYLFEFVNADGQVVATKNENYVTGTGLKTGNMNGVNKAFTPGTYQVYVTLSASSSNASKYLKSERTLVCDYVQAAVELQSPTDFTVDQATGKLTWTDTNSANTASRRYKITYTFSDGRTDYVYSSTAMYNLSVLTTAPKGLVTLTIQAVKTANNEAYVTESSVVTLTYEVEGSTTSIDEKWVGTWEYTYRWDTFTIVINADGTVKYFYATGFTCSENEDGTLTITGTRGSSELVVQFKLTSSGQLQHVSGDSENPYTYTKQ
ncbi:MAG: hypothetical protein NC182_00675 [Prevotella sp.]|nr:hypothetical protein [Staphylococcus sp.]MCM1349699.1 hypothetical protein [Prevotella sp.]